MVCHALQAPRLAPGPRPQAINASRLYLEWQKQPTASFTVREDALSHPRRNLESILVKLRLLHLVIPKLQQTKKLLFYAYTSTVPDILRTPC